MEIDHAYWYHVMDHYGYFGLFGLLMLGVVGLPVPDETLLVIVGTLVRQGHMRFTWTLVAAFLGSCSGITVSFLLGKFLGKEVIARFGRFLHLTEERLNRMEIYMERYGKLTLFFGYFVPGLRNITALTAGFGQMKFKIFAPYAYIGAFAWAATFLVLGNVIGGHLHHIEKILYPFRYYIGVVVLLSLVTPILWRTIRRRR